ncbi:MAG: hypothetical protein NT069_12415 [Planctomycetota bacterium]|nr:hypothetical protein [Planctomycetota bacterium]
MRKFRFVAAGLFVACAAPFAIAFEEPAQPAVVVAKSDATEVTATNDSNDATPAVAEPAPAPVIPTREIGSLAWHTDYKFAYREAREQRKMLLVFFRDDKNAAYYDNFERVVLASPHLAPALGRVARVVVPAASTDYGRPLTNGQRERLLDHPSFSFMYRTPGLAMIDLASVGSGVYGRIVSAHPFMAHRAEGVGTVQTMLSLPPGTITQRALVYAMRTHPSAPQGANYG